MLLLDNVVAGRAEIRRFHAKHRAIFQWRGVIRVEGGRLRHVESDAVTEPAEPYSTGRQVQRRTDGAAETARGWDSIERYRGIESPDGASIVIALGRRGSTDGVHATVVRPVPIDHDATVDEKHFTFLPAPLGRIAEQTTLDSGDGHRVPETVRTVGETRRGEGVVDLALAHPRSQRGVEVREGAFEDVARRAHPLDFPIALTQARRPDDSRRVEAPDACRQKIDDAGRRRVHRSQCINPNRGCVALPQQGGEHLTGVWGELDSAIGKTGRAIR